MIAVSYHDSADVLQEAKLIPIGPFDRIEWFKLVEQYSEYNSNYVISRDNSGTVALPLAHHAKGRLAPLINWYSFIWRPLTTAGADRQNLLRAAANHMKRLTRRVVIAPIPDEDGSATQLEQAFREAGWFVSRTVSDSNHVLRPAGRDFATYLASRPGKLRTTLSRKSKKLSCEIISSFKDTNWDIYQNIYNESWKPDEGAPDLLKAFARQEGDAGRIRLAIARHEGLPVAAQFWTVENGTAYIHKLAHTPQSQNLSAGTVLTAALLRHVIDQDYVELVDFGTGNDRYKADWMEDIRPRYRLDCHNPGRVASWPHIARAVLQRLASNKSAG